MQVPLALGCGLAGVWSAWILDDPWIAGAAILVVAAIPFTLIAIMPTNKQLLDPALDPQGETARRLLIRWGRLHSLRSVLSVTGFVILGLRLAL